MKAYAQVDIGNSFLPVDSPFRGEGGTIGNLVSEFLPIIFFAASALTTVYFIYGAISYIYSGGDPKAKEAAQKKITYAVLGFTLVVLSFLLSQFLSSVLHIGPEPTTSCELQVARCRATRPSTNANYTQVEQANPPFPPLCTSEFPQGPCQDVNCNFYCYKL